MYEYMLIILQIMHLYNVGHTYIHTCIHTHTDDIHYASDDTYSQVQLYVFEIERKNETSHYHELIFDFLR